MSNSNVKVNTNKKESTTTFLEQSRQDVKTKLKRVVKHVSIVISIRICSFYNAGFFFSVDERSNESIYFCSSSILFVIVLAILYEKKKKG